MRIKFSTDFLKPKNKAKNKNRKKEESYKRNFFKNGNVT